MKKVVIIITVLVYIASIAVVNILGGEILTLDGAIYPSQIVIDEVRQMDGGDNGLGTIIPLKSEETGVIGNSYFYEFYYDKTEFDNGNYPVVRFTYHVYPEDATNKNVLITPDAGQHSNGYSDFNEDLCQITIKKQGRGVKYTIMSELSSNVVIFLYVTCMPYN